MGIKYCFFVCFNEIFRVINSYIVFDIEKYFYVVFVLSVGMVLWEKWEKIYYKRIVDFEVNVVWV